MRTLALAAFALFLALCAPAQAQDALVVQTCGTLPLAYAPGATRLITVDVTGKLCASGGGGGGLAAGAAVTGCPAQANLFVTSGLTLGCVAAVTESDTGATLSATGILALPDTTGGGAAGMITLGGARWLHDIGANSNVFLGRNAANLTYAGTQATCVGESCMLTGVSGANNTCIGRFCMGNAVTGSSNTAVGSGTMGALTSGGSNVGVGNGANGVSIASNTTCVGASSCGALTGAGTTAVGFQAGLVSTGATNVFVGLNAGNATTTAANNTFVGSSAGTTGNAGAGNTIVGANCTVGAAATNTIALGNTGCAAMLDFARTTAAVWTFLGGTIAVPLATDATHTDATVCRDTTTGQFFFGSGAAGICLGTSSIRFKQDIAPLAAGLEELLHLDTVSYRYRPGYGDPDHKLYGFTAEQMATVLPELVRNDTEGRPNSVDWAGLVPVLVRAIQEQQREIDALKAKVR